MSKSHYFDTKDGGWKSLCGKTFTYLDGNISALGLDDLTCGACRKIFLARGLTGETMHPETAWLIIRKAISASPERRELAFKSLGME